MNSFGLTVVPPDVDSLAVALRPRLAYGTLVGDTSCVSRRLHVVDYARPSSIRVIGAADAGRVFYRRQQAGVVVHLDVFHQVAEIDHLGMARSVREVCAEFALTARLAELSWVPPGLIIPDLIDIQTATGGGRVTGDLRYGLGATLRESHLNHVHLACMLPDCALGLVFWLIAAVEREVERQRVEIRRLTELVHDPGLEGQPLDLGPYATPSDSLLKGGSRDGVAREMEESLNPGLARLALDLAGEFGTLEDLQRGLEGIARSSSGDRWPWRHKRSHRDDAATSVLTSQGLVREDEGTTALTDQGWRLYYALQCNRRELETKFKMLLRRRQGTAPVAGRGTRTRHNSGVGEHDSRTAKETCPVPPGLAPATVAAVPTAIAAASRQLPALAAGQPWTISKTDLREPRRRPRQSSDVCILLDGSASMAGRRLRAAKFLAQHLLLATRDRVAVIVFQEREARVVVPFTRDFRAAERGLATIEPLGLTPLAEGLTLACEYSRLTRRKNCCLLLITDGIPTVPKWGVHPMDDARRAAAEVSRRRLRLVCLGLEPNRGFLTELSAAARGTLYVVSELEPEALLRALDQGGILTAGGGY